MRGCDEAWELVGEGARPDGVVESIAKACDALGIPMGAAVEGAEGRRSESERGGRNTGGGGEFEEVEMEAEYSWCILSFSGWCLYGSAYAACGGESPE